MKKSLKVAFLYIGTAIGAGFSSGKEIALFFGGASALNVAISSVFMSLLCALFLIAGKNGLMPKNALMKIGIFISASISLCSMLAGSEFVLRDLLGVPMLGLAVALVGGTLVVLGIEKIKLVNSVLVPLIVICVAAIFFKLDPQPSSVPFGLVKPILYSGLDVLLGGVIMAEEGEKLTYREIFLTSGMICIILFGLLFMLGTVVLADGAESSMPVLTVSEKFGLKPLCGILIAVAIFTTLVSSLKIVSDLFAAALKRISPLSTFGGSKSLCVFFCLLIAYPLSFFGFDAIVNNMYPFMSACGVALTAFVVLKFALKAMLCICKKIRAVKAAHKNKINDDVHAHRSRNRRTRHRHHRLGKQSMIRTANACCPLLPRQAPLDICKRGRRKNPA